MPLDDDRDEPDAFGAPLPPEDRLWRHPSEVVDHGPPAGGAASHSRAPLRHRPALSVGAALLAGLAGAAFVLAVVSATGQHGGARQATGPSDTAQATTVSLAAATAAATVLPAVARLAVTDGDEQRSASAVVYRADGFLLTTAQAVSDNTGITVEFADGRTAAASLVGEDPATEVAVLRVDASGLPSAALSSNGSPATGDAALVVSGDGDLIDAVVRSVGQQLQLPTGNLRDLIALDRPVPANADGGAIVDAAGQVTGLCVAAPGTSSATPRGFAVPIAVAARAADQLIATGGVHHAWLGVTGTTLGSTAVERLGTGGVEIGEVAPQSPAASAGLHPGDVIVAIDKTPVTSMGQLTDVTLERDPGDRISIEYVRSAARFTTTVVLG